MSVLVTGATGFLGRALTARLLADGTAVRGLLRRPDQALAAQGVECAIGDVRDAAAVRAATTGMDTVYHTAAVTPGGRGDLWQVNVEGTRQVAMACVASSVRRLVFISSVAVYRPPLAPVIDEDAPVGGLDLYGRSKAAGETIVREVCTDVAEHVILRPCQVYGPGDRSGYTERLEGLAAWRSMPVCRGPAEFSLVHIADVAEAVLAAGTRQAASGQVFNVAGPRRLSLREFCDNPARSDSPKRRIVIPRSAVRAALSTRWFLCAARNPNVRPRWRSYSSLHTHGSIWLGGPEYLIGRAGDTLGFVPQVDPIEGIRGL